MASGRDDTLRETTKTDVRLRRHPAFSDAMLRDAGVVTGSGGWTDRAASRTSS
jgi:hypothetical protein